MVVGCYFGDCHYIRGNFEAQAKITMTRKLFRHIGVNEDRIAFKQCSSAEGARFVQLVNEFSKRIRELGALGAGGDALNVPLIYEKLESAHAVLAGEKIRWIIGKRTEFMEKGNKYGEIFTEHEFNRVLDTIILEEFELQEIIRKMRERAVSVKNLASELNIPSQRVFRYVTALRRKGTAGMIGMEGRTPLYELVYEGDIDGSQEYIDNRGRLLGHSRSSEQG